MILVTGGAGYIGSHMCLKLRERGIPHLAIDSLERGWKEALLGTELAVGDIRDRQFLDKVFSSHPITSVVHFAAYIEVGESVKHPTSFWDNILFGTLSLLQAMQRADVDQLVFSSTAAVYGEPEVTPIPETHPKAPTSPYGDAKLAAERLIESCDAAHGLRAVRLRYFNASGGDPEARVGEAHTPETHLIPRAMLSLRGLVPPLKVFGTDYPTPDGTCVRDYIHVLDLVDAHLSALEHLQSGGASREFNVGTGSGYSVREVLEAVEAVAGQSLNAEDSVRRPGDPAFLTADSSALKKEWGWSPQRSDLPTIVRDAWKWMSNPAYGPWTEGP